MRVASVLLAPVAALILTGCLADKPMSMQAFRGQCTSVTRDYPYHICNYFVAALEADSASCEECIFLCDYVKRKLLTQGTYNATTDYPGRMTPSVSAVLHGGYNTGEVPYRKEHSLRDAETWCERYCRSRFRE